MLIDEQLGIQRAAFEEHLKQLPAAAPAPNVKQEDPEPTGPVIVEEGTFLDEEVAHEAPPAVEREPDGAALDRARERWAIRQRQQFGIDVDAAPSSYATDPSSVQILEARLQQVELRLAELARMAQAVTTAPQFTLPTYRPSTTPAPGVPQPLRFPPTFGDPWSR